MAAIIKICCEYIAKKTPAKFGRGRSINQGASTNLLSKGDEGDPDKSEAN